MFVKQTNKQTNTHPYSIINMD